MGGGVDEDGVVKERLELEGEKSRLSGSGEPLRERAATSASKEGSVHHVVTWLQKRKLARKRKKQKKRKHTKNLPVPMLRVGVLTRW